MKRFLILAALAIAPVVAAGCTCERNDQPVCPPVYAQQICPPVVQPACPPAAPVVQAKPVVQQPACPPAAAACPPAPQAPVAYIPAPAAGQITYAQPIQVSGANGVVQYYNPYLQPRVIR